MSSRRSRLKVGSICGRLPSSRANRWLWRSTSPDDAGKAWFIGLPGNPVAAMVTFMVMVRPFILRLQGAGQLMPRSFAQRADFEWLRPDARKGIPARPDQCRRRHRTLRHQGSGVVTSLCWGDGLVINSPGKPLPAAIWSNSCLLRSCCHERHDPLFCQPQGSARARLRNNRTPGRGQHGRCLARLAGAQGRESLAVAKNLRCAINQDMAGLDAAVKSGDEVAFSRRSRRLKGKQVMSIQWFPGHMTSARKKAGETLAMADVVVEVLDARLPQAAAAIR